MGGLLPGAMAEGLGFPPIPDSLGAWYKIESQRDS